MISNNRGLKYNFKLATGSEQMGSVSKEEDNWCKEQTYELIVTYWISK